MAQKIRPALLLAALAAASALLLSGCSSTPAGTDAPADSAPGDSSVEAPAAPEAPSGGLTGEALPDGWPAEVLLPSGELVLVSERGAGWDLLIEGIDEAELTGLLDEMTAAGFESSGQTDMGSGAWIAELSNGTHVVDYSYESGGAGEPNVHVILVS
jgi:hypothetical protein